MNKVCLYIIFFEIYLWDYIGIWDYHLLRTFVFTNGEILFKPPLPRGKFFVVILSFESFNNPFLDFV